jgi:hypothetical protein
MKKPIAKAMGFFFFTEFPFSHRSRRLPKAERRFFIPRFFKTS